MDSWHVGHLSVCRLHGVSLGTKQLSSSPLFSSAAGINTSGEHQDVSFALKILELFKVHPAASLMDQAWLLGGAAEITVYPERGRDERLTDCISSMSPPLLLSASFFFFLRNIFLTFGR